MSSSNSIIPSRIALVSDAPTRLVYDTVWLTTVGNPWKPVVAPPADSLGIAAALIAELLQSAHATIVTDRTGDHLLMPLQVPTPPTDSLGLALIDQVWAEPGPQPIRQWLQYLASDDIDIYSRVAEHMVIAGLMRRHEHTVRKRLRQRNEVIYRPVESLVADAPMHRLRRWLEQLEEPIAASDTFLMGLCEAVGLETALYRHRSDAARERAEQHQRALPEAQRVLLGRLAETVSTAATSTII